MNDFLTFTCILDGSISMSHYGTNASSTKPNIEYSLNGGDWTSWDGSKISLSVGNVLRMRGINPNGISSSTVNYSSFLMTSGEFQASGNIMSLIDGQEDGTKVIPCDLCFKSMFEDCTSLVTAPVLPATTLAIDCYEYMFQGCSSLTSAPALPATTLASSCYIGMFSGCTSLVNAPALPATILVKNCYNSMFSSCTNLVIAPELPAEILEVGSYRYMFSGCTKLNYIKCFATNISATTCTYSWLSNVSPSGTFVKAKNMTGWTRDENGIPVGWTVKDDGEVAEPNSLIIRGYKIKNIYHQGVEITKIFNGSEMLWEKIKVPTLLRYKNNSLYIPFTIGDNNGYSFYNYGEAGTVGWLDIPYPYIQVRKYRGAGKGVNVTLIFINRNLKLSDFLAGKPTGFVCWDSGAQKTLTPYFTAGVDYSLYLEEIPIN